MRSTRRRSIPLALLVGPAARRRGRGRASRRLRIRRADGAAHSSRTAGCRGARALRCANGDRDRCALAGDPAARGIRAAAVRSLRGRLGIDSRPCGAQVQCISAASRRVRDERSGALHRACRGHDCDRALGNGCGAGRISDFAGLGRGRTRLAVPAAQAPSAAARGRARADPGAADADHDPDDGDDVRAARARRVRGHLVVPAARRRSPAGSLRDLPRRRWSGRSPRSPSGSSSPATPCTRCSRRRRCSRWPPSNSRMDGSSPARSWDEARTRCGWHGAMPIRGPSKTSTCAGSIVRPALAFGAPGPSAATLDFSGCRRRASARCASRTEATSSIPDAAEPCSGPSSP